MVEAILILVLMIPQIVAAVLSKSMGRNPWFWFFISFLIPIISLIILLFLDDKSEKKSYDLADHLTHKNQEQKPTSQEQKPSE